MNIFQNVGPIENYIVGHSLFLWVQWVQWVQFASLTYRVDWSVMEQISPKENFVAQNSNAIKDPSECHTQSISLKFSNVSQYQQIDHLHMCDENCSFFSNISLHVENSKILKPVCQI